MQMDSLGPVPTTVRAIEMNEPADLVESSAAVMSRAQPGVFFTINDSGNDAVLFALDTNGATRGRWAVDSASNRDWEAASIGVCPNTATTTVAHTATCVFIGDVGDNSAVRPVVTLYAVQEPQVGHELATGNLSSVKLIVRYPDSPHDVESMYAGPDGTIYLLTKRPLKDASGAFRPSLVFRVPDSAWASRDTVTATLLDSLPITPVSASRRTPTDASLSSDSRLLAVRTYGQVYVFATDSTNGRIDNQVTPGICNIAKVEQKAGEGITWLGTSQQLLLTREGRNAPIQIVTCPLPKR